MDAPPPIHGRGTALNPANRFERVHVAHDPDCFDPSEPAPETEYYWDDTKTILSRHDSPDFPFEFGLNPYRGCEHGCIYCYARPYHEYLGLSAGLDFETRIFVKRNAAALLRAEFLKPSWRPSPVVLSGVTDPYQPVEIRLRVTRSVLEVFAEFRNPVAFITKNALICRDLDLLGELARHGAAAATFTIGMLDDEIRRRMEPRTSTIDRRFEALARLSAAGVRTAVNLAPVVPGLTDQDIPGIVQRARDCGASRVNLIPVRLPGAVGGLFEQWLSDHFPGHKAKVLRRIKRMYGGSLDDPRNFFDRMKERSLLPDPIVQLFEVARLKAGFDTLEPVPLNRDAFARPGQTRALF
ncbi:MAG: PA0069 family radical SAM protein [Planctomycetes bacterium]|nr:PA0069 family radical SAM protein [Planctomycetota bacterium]MCL4729284.1 PA0069 family radical SAM protein [Planctomycetota bacterium]